MFLILDVGFALSGQVTTVFAKEMKGKSYIIQLSPEQEEMANLPLGTPVVVTDAKSSDFP